VRGSPRPETGRKVGGGQGEGRGSVRVREGRYRTVRWERERRNLPMSLTAVDAMAAEAGRTEGGDGANRSLKKAKSMEFFFFY